MENDSIRVMFAWPSKGECFRLMNIADDDLEFIRLLGDGYTEKILKDRNV